MQYVNNTSEKDLIRYVALPEDNPVDAIKQQVQETRDAME
jgi:hypothetical protein